MLKAPKEVVAGTEVPTSYAHGKATVARDPPPNLAILCCPSTLSCVLSAICPFTWLGSCRVVNEKEGAMLLTFGKYSTIMNEPGCYVVNRKYLSHFFVACSLLMQYLFSSCEISVWHGAVQGVHQATNHRFA